MPGLDEMAVRISGARGTGNARALLNEIASMLSSLLESGEGGSVDLARVPLDDADYALLEEVLGEGEVHAELETLGMTRVIETAIPGVWWVTHFNATDELIAEFIEVAFCPEILLSPADDVREGLEALRERLADIGGDNGA